MDEIETRLGSRTKLDKLIRRIGVGFTGFVVFWLLLTVSMGSVFNTGLQAMGHFGEAMAFVGVIGAALALGVGTYSLMLQREDIALQLREMKGSADAQRQLAKAQEEGVRVTKAEHILACVARVRSEMQDTLRQQNERVAALMGGSEGSGLLSIGNSDAFHEKRVHKEIVGLARPFLEILVQIEQETVVWIIDPSASPSFHLRNVLSQVAETATLWNAELADYRNGRGRSISELLSTIPAPEDESSKAEGITSS
jgi:hypothetical protein